MINKTIFRQYDIRGIVNEDLTQENSKLIGYFLGLTIKEKIKTTPYTYQTVQKKQTRLVSTEAR